MGVVRDLVVVLHLLGMAAIVGGWFSVLTQPVSARAARSSVNRAMLWGARAQIITGLVLVGIQESGAVDDDADPNHAKIAVKLLVALVVAALAEISSGRGRRGESVPWWFVHAVGGLAIANVLVAVLW